MGKLSHISASGEAQMVDISSKATTHRIALAEAIVSMNPDTLSKILEGGMPKGDVLAVARIAGIQAAKRTSELIPLCHPLPITKINIEFLPLNDSDLQIQASVTVNGQTGVEMEALTAATIAALTIYDMCKAVQKDISIGKVRLLQKTGGKSGTWQAK